jgi:hypothetical protein
MPLGAGAGAGTGTGTGMILRLGAGTGMILRLGVGVGVGVDIDLFINLGLSSGLISVSVFINIFFDLKIKVFNFISFFGLKYIVVKLSNSVTISCILFINSLFKIKELKSNSLKLKNSLYLSINIVKNFIKLSIK